MKLEPMNQCARVTGLTAVEVAPCPDPAVVADGVGSGFTDKVCGAVRELGVICSV